MAETDVRISELNDTTTSAANDDYIALDGATYGTRKMLASNLVGPEASARAAGDEALDGKIGTLSNLTTTAKGSAVAAINEVDSHADAAQDTADTNAAAIGTLSSLATDAKGSLVAAINEVDSHADGKVDKVNGKGLSTNDYTDAEKTKLSGIEAGAEVNDVTSVAGKTGAVTLAGGDVSYSDETTYADGTIGAAVSELKSDLSDIFIKQFVEKNIANIDNVVKLSGYSFGTDGASKVSGSSSASYDSYYFYTSKDTAMYFTSAAPSAPTYIALTVGYNPSKTWNTVGGQMQMSCQNATRKRKSENNLPTSAAQMDVSEAIVILTVNVSTTTSFYINSDISLSDDIGLPLEQTTGQSTTKAMSQKAITEAINGKVPMLKYTSGGSGFSGIEHVDIYIPTFDGYIDYWFAHNKDTATNSDIWRIDAAYMVDDSLANPVAFTTAGEWEIAIKLEGRSDFSGGYIHGDEVCTDIVFIVDGAVVDITDYMTATPFESLCILQKSNMYDPNDSTTVFGVHTSEHIFSKGTDKIQINQSLLWSGDYTLGYSYMGMFPIAQTVSDYWYSNKDYLPEAISNGYRKGITKAVLLKESTKTIGQFISEQLPTLNSTANKSFNITNNGGTSYNKCYYVLCGNDGTASSGDLWESKTTYALSKGV